MREKRYLNRCQLTTEPTLVYRAGAPMKLTIWVSTRSIDSENPQNALVSIDEDNESEPWRGSPLPFDQPIVLPLEENDELWAKSEDVSVLSVVLEPWLGPSV